MRALVTGGSGFLGRHLTRHLAAEGAEVYALSRGGDAPGEARRAYAGSIDDVAFVSAVIAETRPTHVFHLAGLLGGTGAPPSLLYQTNVIGTAVFLDAVLASGIRPIVILSGSSAVYGQPARLPIPEDAAFQPTTDYAASKVAQEMTAICRHHSHGLRVIRTRNFNLIGPGQPETLLAASIARQVASAEAGGPPVVRLRSTEGRRDFVDVRDAARAHAMLATRGTPGQVYNIASGVARAVSEAVDVMVRRSTTPLRVEVAERVARANSVHVQIGSFERLYDTTQWRPAIAFEQSLADLLEETRAVIKRKMGQA